MIIQYFRPKTMEEALKLLAQPKTRPLGGGTTLTQKSAETFSVVDLQALNLNQLYQSGNSLEIGATVTLQDLLESSLTDKALKAVIELEAPLNIRNMKTVAGALVTCKGRSPFGTAMLALDARLVMMREKESSIRMGDLLPLREETLRGQLIIKVEIPSTVRFAFETVARTPADKPIVCAALTQWPSGRTRLALGGWGAIPLLAMDGNEPGGIEAAARNAFAEAGDEWASSEYRMEIAGILAKRCLQKIK